jgi:hypothetical protein
MNEPNIRDDKTLDERTIAALCEEYKDREGSREFILAIADCFYFLRSHYKIQMIRMVFAWVYFRSCNVGLVKRLASHWHNVGDENLSRGRYEEHIRNMSTVARLRIFAHYLETKNILCDDQS